MLGWMKLNRDVQPARLVMVAIGAEQNTGVDNLTAGIAVILYIRTGTPAHKRVVLHAFDLGGMSRVGEVGKDNLVFVELVDATGLGSDDRRNGLRNLGAQRRFDLRRREERTGVGSESRGYKQQWQD